MMQTFVAWLLMLLILLTAYGWSAWLISLMPNGASRVLVISLTVALSIGALTQIMFCLSLVNVKLDSVIVTIVYWLATLPGWWLLWRKRVKRSLPIEPELQVPRLRTQLLAVVVLLAIGAAILFNAAYWPFSRDDAIGIYDAQAQEIVATEEVLPLPGADSLYRAYPALMPLAYAYTYQVSGWHNEYLARMIPALMSLGTLAAAYLLGREARGERAGWLSALILAVTPTFGRWASAGYVDLPTAFYYALSAYFALRLWRSSDYWADALLAGLMMGLAAWTKNAALIGVGLLGIWLLWALANRRIALRHAVIAMMACGIVAAPWYIRNLVGAGFLLPDTAWTQDAEHTLETALIFLTHPEIYGLSGCLFAVGFALVLWRFGRAPRRSPVESLLLLWTVPFFGLWWWFASYDPRFLLHILPLFAVMAGAALATVHDLIPPRWQRFAALAGAGLLFVLAAQAIWNSVEFKDEMLRVPLMSDEAKHALVLRGRETE
jgi:4-amino-4-deoxy-L-arabinose transferase-like glycosyltransferase